jgi:predicted transcriptional regulator
MSKKVTVILPDETVENLNVLAKSSQITLSAAATASIEYFSWLIQESNMSGYKVLLEKVKNGKTETKEAVLPRNYKFYKEDKK